MKRTFEDLSVVVVLLVFLLLACQNTPENGLNLPPTAGDVGLDDARGDGEGMREDEQPSEDQMPGHEAVNGTCVPHGALFTDTFSCALVMGPSGSAALESTAMVNDPDPQRLEDPDLGWVLSEIAACSCICCHGPPGEGLDGPTGEGRHVWNYLFEPTWTDSTTSRSLRILSGLTPPPNSGGIPPEENHGFSRRESGLPTTDVERLRAFVERELARRGD